MKKGEIVRAAFAKNNIGELTSPMTPNESEVGLNLLDGMMLTMDAQGVRLRYSSSSPNKADPNDESMILEWALESVIVLLAKRIASNYAKSITPELKNEIRFATQTLANAKVGDTTATLPYSGNMPIGRGNWSDWYPVNTYYRKPHNVTAENAVNTLVGNQTNLPNPNNDDFEDAHND